MTPHSVISDNIENMVNYLRNARDRVNKPDKF